MEIIVTGGAGYIGSHVVNQLCQQGVRVICFDSLSSGFKEFVNPSAEFVLGDIRNSVDLKKCFDLLNSPTTAGVIHLAGLKYASFSVKNPLEFYEVNLSGTINLVNQMVTSGVHNIVFSSSCSVYGNTSEVKGVVETNNLLPLSPYARSKLYAENILDDARIAYDLKVVSLRYFNVAGKGKQGGHDLSPYNVFPNIYRSLSTNLPFTIFGNDFSTSDGTCIRDYVDVDLLSELHVKVMNKLLAGENLNSVYNLGSESGYSVLEIVKAVKEEIDENFAFVFAGKRLGDPARILADCSSAKRDLGWHHSVDLKKMVRDGWDGWIASPLSR
jgi:UDP-glucose 4-epimerase